jgi:hypothetical protein
LFANDVGATEVLAPQSGSGLGMETISITVKNFGAASQTGFDVQYVINGDAPVIETFTPTILSEEEVTFNFATQGDFSILGTYDVTVSTNLTGDSVAANDATTVQIENLLCMPMMDCSLGDGLQLFRIAEIDNPSACEGYGDFTNLVANLDIDATYDLTLTTGWGSQHVNVWIDFDDNFTFTPNELVVNDFVIADGQGQGSYTATTDLVVPAGATAGMHIMRAKTNWNAPVPTDACEETQFGETEDYTANIGVLGVQDFVIEQSELIATSLPNNQFDIRLITNLEGPAYIGIYNVLGQQLKFKTVQKDGDSYRVKLDMSIAQSGVYFIKMGSQQATKYASTKIIVK